MTIGSDALLSPHWVSHVILVANVRMNKSIVTIPLHSFTDNGDRLLATGGEDSFIAIWRFKAEHKAVPDDFEFQVVQFKSQKVVFDSMIVGHEGWINSLQWNETGERT